MTTLQEKHLRWKTPAIKIITNKLNLSIAGSIELTVFPEEVLEQAVKEIKYSKIRDIKDNGEKFLYLLKICHNICKAKSLVKNPMFTKSLKLEFGITEDMDFIESDLEALEALDPFDESNEEVFKISQKRENRILSSSLNAQLSYKMTSGERPSASKIDVANTYVSQFEADAGIVKNAFTTYLYEVFKRKTDKVSSGEHPSD